MAPDELEERITWIRRLIREIHHVALATVSADGSPHVSPVFAAFDDKLNVFWESHPESLHSKNIERTGQVFVALFDSREGHGGLYIEATAGALTRPADIEAADTLRAQAKKALDGIEYPPGIYPHDKTYRAVPLKTWISKSERTADGVALRDRRHEISVEELLDS